MGTGRGAGRGAEGVGGMQWAQLLPGVSAGSPFPACLASQALARYRQASSYPMLSSMVPQGLRSNVLKIHFLPYKGLSGLESPLTPSCPSPLAQIWLTAGHSRLWVQLRRLVRSF